MTADVSSDSITINEATTKSSIAKKTWLLFVSIYTTQYLGVSFIFASSMVIMREQGMPLQQIALINIIALPVLLKIFYAPLIDYLRPPLLKKLQGQYRRWLLLAQMMMTVLLVVISFFDIVQQFQIVLLLMIVYGFSVSVQDVSIDGMACKYFSEDERKFANSIQFSSNLLGNILGGGVLLVLYNFFGWQGSFLLIAACTAIACSQVALFTETSWQQRQGIADTTITDTTESAQQQRTKQPAFSDFLASLKGFVKKHKTWFGLILLYPIGFSSSFGLLKPLLVDAGWQKADIGFALNIYGSIIGVFSALAAGLLIKNVGKYKALISLTIVQALVLLALLPLALGYTANVFVYLAIGLYFLVHPALLATIATHAMDRASTETAKGSFFTMQLGIFSFMGFVYAGLGTALAKFTGYAGMMMASFVVSCLIIVYLMSLVQKQRI